MKTLDFVGKRVVVLGLGVHGGGLAVTKWLVKHKAQTIVTDIKNKYELAISIKKLKGLPIRYVLGKHPISLLDGCDMVIQNPGVSTDHPFLKEAQKRKIVIENEASLFFKLCPTKKLVVVSGTRGKSTTVSLLGEIMKEVWPKTIVAGNIKDVVLFDILDKLDTNNWVVIELSSWQLEGVGRHKQRLPIAVLTNILPDHLNRYKSFAEYIRAKANIFRFQNPKDAVVMNYDNEITRQLAKKAPSRVYWFSLKNQVPRGCFVKNKWIYSIDGKKINRLLPQKDVGIIGQHNLANVLAAITVAKIFNINNLEIKKTLKKFKGLHDRMELIKVLSGVCYYNDTTSTSPDACIAALKSFPKSKIVLIAGGTDKSLSYKKMAKEIKARVTAMILLPGTATVKLQQELKNFKKIFLASNMAMAVKLANKLALPNSIILLSPGAASFGLFKHEFERGETFKKAVRRLEGHK